MPHPSFDLVYLASRYGRRLELCGYRDQLERAGYTVTSRWLNGSHDNPDPQAKVRYATEDYVDLHTATTLILFTDDQEGPFLPPIGAPPAEEKEQWVLIDGSRLGYAISSFGRVRNGEGEIVHGKIHHQGYRRVFPNGKHGKPQSVHQLVASAFLGPCPPGYEIDHKDTRKNNNWIGNLEYVTHAENIRRARAYGLCGCSKGEMNGRAKLTWHDVADIRQALHEGATKVSLGRTYEVSETVIRHIEIGKLWPIEPDMPSRGGKFVELGMAIAWDKRIVICGPEENVFCSLAQCLVVPDFATALRRLQQEDAAYVTTAGRH